MRRLDPGELPEGLPLATGTDLAVDMLRGTQVADAGDHLVVRTPDNPGYHWGNCLVVTGGDPDDAGHWLARFEEEFPDARHRAIALPRRPASGVWEARGVQVERVDALESARPPSPTGLPDGCTVARLTTDEQWTARESSEIAENALAGEHPEQLYVPFIADQIRGHRRLVADGRAAWFGVFGGGGELAASLGIVDLGGLARYQSVLTAAAHRRRGLARHLLAVAARWAAGRGATRLVIVAEAGSDADRLYRRAGFAPAELSYDVYCPG